MIELSFIACLLLDKEKCKEEFIYLELNTTMQCMMVSQIELSKWNESHPKYFIKKWTCSPNKHKNL